MLQEAKQNPKFYGYFLGVASYMGFGTEMKGDKAEYWLKKSYLLGNIKSTLAYAQLLLTGIPSRCKNDFNSCIKQGLKIKLLEVVNNKLTSIVAKTKAAQLLKDKKTYSLLNQ